MNRVFAPGCALMLYKPHFADKVFAILKEKYAEIEFLTSCCRHEPKLNGTTEVINICPGCDKRYGNDYSNTSTISFWEILAESDFFTFPDYRNQAMSILDACPARDQERVHIAIRTLLQ